jgi:hypothetical protein
MMPKTTQYLVLSSLYIFCIYYLNLSHYVSVRAELAMSFSFPVQSITLARSPKKRVKRKKEGKRKRKSGQIKSF